ncbi:DUF736 family protein [Jannaschia sp. M317]|uniref:DUF736 family protein n=1 Tax=Jannaschia sp. M317 TaxID=2867011 RepID=UPI0021A70C04|nr:DUF736 family protein [Jannaschia sp. M317]UWQ19793.1 DUF736 family protein [Jannaschia sp. M317]
MITGTLTRNADGETYNLSVATLMFDIAHLRVVPNGYKSADNHPDHHIEVRTPRGRVMRVGSMWAATSKTSKREYFQIALTDQMGRTWRMNAVRDEEMPKDVWRIVPLAGGETRPIALTGRIETLDDGNLAGFIGSYDFDMDFVAVENAHKTTDDHPDWHIEARSPAGRIVRMGSIWRATSERSGNAYLSIAFHAPMGTQHRANAFRREDEAPGTYKVVALMPLAEADGRLALAA